MRYTEFKPLLNEVNMSPGSLQNWLQGPAAAGMTMGFEAEMCVPCQNMPPIVDDIESIIEFFGNGDPKLEIKIGKALASAYKHWVTAKYNKYLKDNPDFKYDVEERVFKELSKEYGEDEAYQMIDYATDEYTAEYERVIAEHKKYFFKMKIHSTSYWLSSLDVNNMLDIAGLDIGGKQELELPPEYNPLTNLLDGFKKAVKTDVVQSNLIYHGVERSAASYENWIIEPDVTIQPAKGQAAVGLEFISPAKPIAETLANLENTVAWANAYGCTTNESTGLHVNVSIPDFDRSKLDYIKLALFLGDEYILSQFNRLYNSQCDSVLRSLRNDPERFDVSDENGSMLLNQMRQNMTTRVSQFFHNSITDKYVSINAKENWVEFRGPGGNYLKHDIRSLISVAIRTAMALQIACNEQLYRKEYLRKLYTLVNPELGTSAVELFAKSAANELNKSELKSLLKDLKKVKEIEKQYVEPTVDPTKPIAKKPLPVYNTSAAAHQPIEPQTVTPEDIKEY
jgi:hypothetical protein